MAHGENAEKWGKRGKEYWKSRLHRYGEVPGRITKLLTHRKERRVGKLIVRKEIL
jgi:hypothetical protein